MPRINLIPWREAERKRKRQEFGVGALGALLAAGAIAFLVNLQMGAAIDNQLERNTYLNGEIAQLDKQITEILALEQQKQRRAGNAPGTGTTPARTPAQSDRDRV